MITFEKKFYVCTAIAYPNGRPHLGHALEIVQADVLARFYKLLGKDVFFQTGTDEHGSKNWQTAEKEGKDILEFLNENVKVFEELYEKLNISYDNFIRTSDKKVHYPGATKLWQSLEESNDIYKKDYEGLYCAGCESFKTKSELVDGKCVNHPTRTIEKVKEENYFFKLSKYKDIIKEKIESDEFKVIPESRKNEILSFLKDAKDISFSRPKTSLPWGVPVPGDKDQVMYVWCDALSNYITGPGYGSDEKTFNSIWPADIQIIGKDILRFHAAFWPAMLLSAKLPLPKTLFVHGFILSRGTKMGKSTGNVIEPFDQMKKYGVDPFRFYLLESMPLDGDGEYSEDIFRERINTELVANIGNLCYRVLSFLEKNFEGAFTEIEEDRIFSEVIKRSEKVKESYEKFNFKEAIQQILQISSLGNKYFQDNEPWKLIKEDKERTQRILGSGVNIIKIVGILLSPILPEFSETLRKQLNLSEGSWDDINFNLKNHKVGKPTILFEKVEEEEQKPIFPLNLKVGKVLEAKNHPDADKLMVVQVDVGSEKRQLVAGKFNEYTVEEFANKNIIVVTNLKHAKLRGVESQGMLLAGDDGKKEGIVTSNEKVGTEVAVEGYNTGDKQISFDSFKKLDLKVKDGKAFFNDVPLTANKKQLGVEFVKEGIIR